VLLSRVFRWVRYPNKGAYSYGALYYSTFFGNDVKPDGDRFLEELTIVSLSYVKSLNEKGEMFSDMYVETGSYV